MECFILSFILNYCFLRESFLDHKSHSNQVIFLHVKMLIFYISHFFYIFLCLFINLLVCLFVVYISRICSMNTGTLSSIKCLAILAHNKYLLNEE